MVTLYSVGLPLPVDVRDAIEVRVVALIFILDHFAAGRCLISTKGNRAMQPRLFDGLAQKGFGRLRIPPCS